MKKIILVGLFILNLNADITLTATVISDNEKYITSRFMGHIQELQVSEGSYVKQGDLLYKIDSTDIDAKRTQALLQVSMYLTQLSALRRNYERFQRLYKKGLVPKVQVEEIETNYNNLKDMVSIAKAQVQEVENQYKYLNIEAPNNGVITKKMIKVGEMAIPGVPALVLTDLSNLRLKAEISESNLKNIHLNQKVSIQIPSIEFQTIGTIESIIPSSNPMTHTFMIKINFKSQKNIYPGMYAKATIKVNNE